jgi:hypothetical protein
MCRLLLFSCGLALLSPPSAAWFFGGSGRQQATGEISEECIKKAADGDCTFYICFDQRHMCERHNYALSYGWRYCDLMNSNFDKFTHDAKEWIINTRVCSMTKMLEFYREEHINCHDVEQEMQERHGECEAEHGVCDHNLITDNREVLMDIYGFNRKTLNRFAKMIKECGLDAGSELLAWLNTQRHSIVDFFKSLKDRFENVDEELEKIRASIRDRLPDISKLPEIPNYN